MTVGYELAPSVVFELGDVLTKEQLLAHVKAVKSISLSQPISEVSTISLLFRAHITV
jgi:hypothetical protein